MLGDLIVMQFSGVGRDDLRAVGNRCEDPPDPRVVPFPLGADHWQRHERERVDGGRSTYRNDRQAA